VIVDTFENIGKMNILSCGKSTKVKRVVQIRNRPSPENRHHFELPQFIAMHSRIISAKSRRLPQTNIKAKFSN